MERDPTAAKMSLLSNIGARSLREMLDALEIVGPDRRSVMAMRRAIAQSANVSVAGLDAAFLRGGVTAVERETRVPDATFVAIDFETADNGRDSACQVGIVRVEHGRIVDRYSRLIRPPRRTFLFTNIHGLGWEDVRNEPAFGQLWPEMESRLRGAQVIYAHSAAFDRSVMNACCSSHSVRPPTTRWACTVALAQRTWPLTNHKLPTVCGHLGIELDHHNAASDAEACARIVLAAKTWSSEKVGTLIT